MASQSARDRFRRRVRTSFERADEAFRGQYAEEIQGLLGLSEADIDKITPGNVDLQTYHRLIEVVKEASRVNVAQAELKRQIEALGEVAVQIAKKVPKLAALL